MGRGFRSEVVVGLMVLAIFVLGAIFFSDVPPLEHIHSMRTWQEADAPVGYPVEVSADNPDGRVPVFEGDFLLLDAFARFRIPPAQRFDSPLGAESGSFTEVRETFLAPRDEDGLRHLGETLAFLGSRDPEASGAVRAIGNGLVVYAADRGQPRGRTVVIGHRLPDGRIVHSLYGGLGSIDVAPGSLVARGQKIGLLGGGDVVGGPPLHFEVYEGPMIDLGEEFGPGPLNRRPPSELWAGLEGDDPSDLVPEPLAIYELDAQVFQLGGDNGSDGGATGAGDGEGAREPRQ